MPGTLTRGATVVTPTLILGYQVVSTVPSVQHDLLDGTVTFTLRAARPRTGTLQLFFATQAAALTGWTLHRTLGNIVYTDTDLPPAGMTYIAVGDLVLELDPETRVRWTLTVPFREVI